jgi:isocitrate dehydrogenase
MQNKRVVTVIPGDGIGPECINSAMQIIEAAGVEIEWEERHAGASVFKQGIASGVPEDTIASIKKTRVALKGPLETPVGFGQKSANVTLRKLFETYANIRPAREFPGVTTPYSGRGIDIVIVRENVEDLYAGIEHMQTPGVAQCLKLISRKGCEKIVRTAFEFARAEGRKSVACATKANIMKNTEGLLKKTFEEIAPEYPDIESWHVIIDNCAHQLVKKPEQYDVIVTTNMNGDIISDLTSGLIGGLGFAPTANLGNDVAIFEAVHGSAPKYAGKDVINPTAVILSAVMMLRHIGEFDAATLIENAVMVTIEEGEAATGDIVGYDKGTPTSVYTQKIIDNLGRKPAKWQARDYRAIKMPNISEDPVFVTPKSRRVLGADIFVEWQKNAESLGRSLDKIVEASEFRLKMISNRGTKVYPVGDTSPDCVDHWRCRFVLRDANADASPEKIIELLTQISSVHKWMHVEKLMEVDGESGYTMAQGED